MLRFIGQQEINHENKFVNLLSFSLKDVDVEICSGERLDHVVSIIPLLLVAVPDNPCCVVADIIMCTCVAKHHDLHTSNALTSNDKWTLGNRHVSEGPSAPPALQLKAAVPGLDCFMFGSPFHRYTCFLRALLRYEWTYKRSSIFAGGLASRWGQIRSGRHAARPTHSMQLRTHRKQTQVRLH